MESFITEYPNALSADQCASMIQKYEASSHKNPGRTGSGVDVSKKDSLDLYLSALPDWQLENQQLVLAVRDALIRYVKQFPFLITGAISLSYLKPGENTARAINNDDVRAMSDEQLGSVLEMVFEVEPINLQKYKAGRGGYPHWHSEHYPHPTDPQQRSLHRVLLWLLYLNDVEHGGETEFYYQKLKITPTTGTLVIAPCTFCHTHRGNTPKSGDKYVLASWISYKPANLLYGQHN